MANDKPVIVRLASGAEYGIQSAAEAKRIYPNAEIVRYQSGEPYEGAGGDEPTVNLDDLTRDELNAYAEKVGVADAASLSNKAAVIAAIEDAR